MSHPISRLFQEDVTIKKIQERLPYLFQIAEIESSRSGKIGMQVGSLRENIIIALLKYKFGERAVSTDIPITEAEIDVKLLGQPISIKTISGTGYAGVKLIWTVDSPKALEFYDTYYPRVDVIFVRINWGGSGGFYFIPVAVQRETFKKCGKEEYIKLPKVGTNPRGVEITKRALYEILHHKNTCMIPIRWEKVDISIDPYKRWVDYWK